jgi:hypothetical protein
MGKLRRLIYGSVVEGCQGEDEFSHVMPVPEHNDVGESASAGASVTSFIDEVITQILLLLCLDNDDGGLLVSFNRFFILVFIMSTFSCL